MINSGSKPGSPAEQIPATPTGGNADVIIGADGRPVIPELIVTTSGKGNEMLNILVNDSFST